MRSIKIIFGLVSGILGAILLQSYQQQYRYKYESDSCIINYSYLVRNDSSFIRGLITQRSDNAPVYNMNILMKGYSIGTVPDLKGRFKLFLPKPKGKIIFDKSGYERFEFSYKFNEGVFPK